MTPRRSSKKKSTRSLSINVEKLKEIIDLAARVYASAEGVRLFLSEPQPVFGGRTAYQLISNNDYDPIISALIADLEGSIT